MRLAASRVEGFFYTGLLIERVAAKSIDELYEKAFLMLGELMEKVEGIHQGIFGVPSIIPEQVMIEITDDIKEGKIGSYYYPDGEQYYGLLRLRPKALTPNSQYGYWVIAHELIHAALGEEISDNHGPEFQMMADAIGMPTDLQD